VASLYETGLIAAGTDWNATGRENRDAACNPTDVA